MIRGGDKKRRGWVARYGLGLLAMLLGWSATPACAETLIFHNDAHAAVVVQVVSVFRGVFRRDRPYLLRPGDVTTPGVMLPGDKVITISDAKVLNRVLFQGALPTRSLDQHFSIRPDVPSPRVRLRMLTPPNP